MPRTRRSLAALLLAASLCVPGAAWAAPRSPADSRTAPAGVLARFWNLLTAFWAEEGCWIDPNGGRCAGPQNAAPARNLRDEGCGIDPDGRCHGGAASAAPVLPAFPDEGCGIDPNGRCGSTH